MRVAPEFAKFVGGPAQVRACWAGSCHQALFLSPSLSPSTRSIDQGCTPDGTCSARSVLTGGKDGFADVPGLPAEPVVVTLTIPKAPGGRAVHGTVTVTPRTIGPGANCSGPGGVQAEVFVDATGTVQASSAS